MTCKWNVECIVNEEITEEDMKDIICSKIANVLIREEIQNCTLVKQN